MRKPRKKQPQAPPVQLGPMQKALVDAEMVERPKKIKKKKDNKEFKCKKCQTVMNKIDDSNIIVCPNCNQYMLVN